MSHVSPRDIETMSSDQLLRTLDDLKDELLQLRAQQALGGSSSPELIKKTRGESRYLGYAIRVAFHKRYAYARRLPKSSRRQSSR